MVNFPNKSSVLQSLYPILCVFLMTSNSVHLSHTALTLGYLKECEVVCVVYRVCFVLLFVFN